MKKLREVYDETVRDIMLINSNRKFIVINMVFFFLTYLMLITMDLSNQHDGVWNAYNSFEKQTFGLGRWFIPISQLMRAATVNIGFISVFYVALISIAYLYILETFGIRNGRVRYIPGFIFTASPVVCDIIAYQYTAIGYGFAFLFSVLAEYYLVKYFEQKKTYQIVYSCVLIVLAMSSYQAYIGVVLEIIIFVMITKVLKGNIRQAGNIIAYFLYC